MPWWTFHIYNRNNGRTLAFWQVPRLQGVRCFTRLGNAITRERSVKALGAVELSQNLTFHMFLAMFAKRYSLAGATFPAVPQPIM